MVLTTMFAVNQHRSVINTQLGIVRQDISLRSTGVGQDLLDEIGSMAFDEATKDDAATDPNQLTSLPMSDQGELGDELGMFQETGGADDLDDFSGLSLERTRTHGETTLGFMARPKVNYVLADGTTMVDYVTKFKKVTLDIVSTDYAFGDTVRVSQVFACGSRCSW